MCYFKIAYMTLKLLNFTSFGEVVSLRYHPSSKQMS